MRFGIIACAILALCAIGCNGMKPFERADESGPIKKLTVATGLRYSDIPVPRGFSNIPQESWTYEAKGGLRLAELRYEGRVSVQKVVEFFETQMPISGWEKELTVGPDTKKRLHFKHKKKSERCKVVVHRTRGKTFLTIDID